MKQDLICILGPTASGKTKLAVSMALQNGAEIISADSRQVYRGMDIGTGKDLSEYTVDGRCVPYHLIDIVDAGYKYNLFEYQRDFNRVYNEIKGRGVTPILCGGTGLYIDAVTKGYSLAMVPQNLELREELEQLEMEELEKMLSSMKRLHNRTDLDSKKRVIRAIEIELYSRESGVEYIQQEAINTKFIGIAVDRDQRNSRIDKRLDERLKEGLVEEVEALLGSGIAADDLIYYGLEYKYVTQYVVGAISFEQMRSSLAIAIHQFAKRQMTWFRGMERRGVNIEWIEFKK